MAVRGGLTRFARRYSAHPWASPLRGQRRRCSKTLPAFLSGQPARRLAVCPTGVASCRTPVGDSHPPRRVPHAKKKPVLAYELFLKYGGEGGLTRFARPCGAARSRAHGLSNWHGMVPLLSGTGANVGKYVSPVNQLFAKSARLDKLRTTCSLNVRNPFFLSPLPFHFATRGNLLCWQTNRKQ
ncbi:hypothetical protein SAMN03159331_00005 [Klebsiella quasipneumoniae]|nr:hypothetical protein SAMN03159331_00005 [Klebsiella quasipneumoniae]